MARTFPSLPEPFGFDPPLSILETLGVDNPAAATVPADGRGLAEAIVNVAPSHVDFEAGNSTATSPFDGLEVADAAAPDLMAGLVTFTFDSGAEAAGSSPAFQPAADASFPDVEGAADAGPEAAGGQPGAAAEGTAVDAGAAARGGPGGGGGGGGGGGTGVPDYFSGSANDTSGYDIQIKFKGTGWTTELREAFEHAADYLTTVITDDIGGGGRIGKVTVDDLYVTAEVKAIDGVGGILGQAGPQYVWTANELTASGQMQFDVADASNYLNKGLWDDIVTHELMHVLGFGSLWNYGDDPLVSGNQYTGEIGLAAYEAEHPGATFIPVEDEGGAGTAGSHWDEEALDNELMTGYINDDHIDTNTADNYLSKFSVMSLADLGYAVNSYRDYPYDGVII